MNNRIIVSMILLLPFASEASVVTFESALQSKQVKYEVHHVPLDGRNMQITLANTTTSPIEVQVETGRIFPAASENVQPFVVIRPATIHLEAKESRKVWMHARCGNSGAHSPDEKTKFRGTQMGDAEMVVTLEKLNSQRITDDHLYQTVVWHYTNGHNVSGIYSSRVAPAILNNLRASLSNREQMPSDWYVSSYKPDPTGNDMTFTGQLESIRATLTLKTPEGENVCIVLKDEQGNIAAVLGYYLNVPAGENDYTIRIPGDGLAKGRYTVEALSKSQRRILERELVI